MKKMDKMIFLILSVLIVAGFGCKKSQEAETQYRLTVQCSAGVAGEPQSGSYPYAENTPIPYNYAPAAGYSGLQVVLDSQAAPTGGTIAMNMNHTLSAAVQRILYFQGNWELDVQWTSQTCTLENASNLAATGTQNGDHITLQVAGMNAACMGTIDLQGSFTLTAEVSYGSKTKFKYTFTGKMKGETSLAGEVAAEGFLNDSPVCAASGKFNANKI
jgi:hypothetical protein